MHTRRVLMFGLVATTLLSAQDVPSTIQVTGAVKQELALSAGDLAKMPRATLRLPGNGAETVYEGGARSVRMLTKLEVVHLRK